MSPNVDGGAGGQACAGGGRGSSRDGRGATFCGTGAGGVEAGAELAPVLAPPPSCWRVPRAPGPIASRRTCSQLNASAGDHRRF